MLSKGLLHPDSSHDQGIFKDLTEHAICFETQSYHLKHFVVNFETRMPVGEGEVGVVALTELKAGENGEIAYLAATDASKMKKLMIWMVLLMAA